MISRRAWERVQRIERAYHEAKSTDHVLDVNLVYWRRILDAVPPSALTIGPKTRVLDVGCGGAGILLGLDAGVRTGIDPLMSYYLEKFPFLRESPVTWREGMAEDFATDEQFDVVFSINMLDHTEVPSASAANLERLLAPGGRLILLLNTHLTRGWRRYFELFFRYIDPPHPHQFYRGDVPALFPRLRLLSEQDVDHLWLDLKDRYEREVKRPSGPKWGRLLRTALNPFKYPLAFSRFVLGRRVFKRRAGDVAMFATTLFVFGKPDGDAGGTAPAPRPA